MEEATTSTNFTNNPGSADYSQPSSNLSLDKEKRTIRREKKRQALDQLERAKSKPVWFALRTNFSYDGSVDDDSPVQGHAVSFDIHDFLHIKSMYNDYWWIGRIVKENCDVGFIPTKRGCSRPGKTAATSFGKEIRNDLELTDPYDSVPSMRPVIVIGPSLKGFAATDIMQKALFDLLKHRFEGRIIITKVMEDISISAKKEFLLMNQKKGSSLAKIQQEFERIFELDETLQLVVLDCDTINDLEQMTRQLNMILAPIIVYIEPYLPAIFKIFREESSKNDYKLQKTATKQRERKKKYDFIVRGNNQNQLEEECLENLFKYLEVYWKATHPPNSTSQDSSALNIELYMKRIRNIITQKVCLRNPLCILGKMSYPSHCE